MEAAGHFIPLVVENVCGAQKWVGKARWHYGSFYLWGDVPALMPMTYRAGKTPPGNAAGAPMWRDRPVQRLCDSPGPEKATKNDGGSWFNVAHNTTSGHGQNPDGRRTSGHLNQRDGYSHMRHLTNPNEHSKKCWHCGHAAVYHEYETDECVYHEYGTDKRCSCAKFLVCDPERSFEPWSESGIMDDRGRFVDPDSPCKQITEADVVDAVKNGGDWFGSGPDCSLQRRQASKSRPGKRPRRTLRRSRLALASRVARAWYPQNEALRIVGVTR